MIVALIKIKVYFSELLEVEVALLFDGRDAVETIGDLCFEVGILCLQLFD